MHIKKLEITGFKSFVDRTVIHFDHDVVGIVGPQWLRQIEHRRRDSVGAGRTERQASTRTRDGGLDLQRLRVARPDMAWPRSR